MPPSNHVSHNALHNDDNCRCFSSHGTIRFPVSKKKTNDPGNPDQDRWGGQYKRRDPATNHGYDGPEAESVAWWLPKMQEDFAMRTDWMWE
jgi:hypothetical protein